MMENDGEALDEEEESIIGQLLLLSQEVDEKLARNEDVSHLLGAQTLTKICQFFELECDRDLSEFVAGGREHYCRLLLSFIVNFFRRHKCLQKSEAMLWIIFMLIKSSANVEVYATFHGFMRERICELASFLSSDSKFVLLKRSIEAVLELEAKRFCTIEMAEFFDSNCVMSLPAVAFDTKLPSCDTLIVRLNFLDLFLHGTLPFERLIEGDLCKFWLLLFKFIENAVPEMKLSSILILQRLSSMNLATSPFLIVFVDVLLALEIRRPVMKITVAELDEAVCSCFSVIIRLIQSGGRNHKSCGTLRKSNIVAWTRRIIQILRMNRSNGKRLQTFLCDSLDILNTLPGSCVGLRELAMEISDYTEFLLQNQTKTMDDGGKISDFVKFLLAVDQIFDESVYFERVMGIIEICKKQYATSQAIYVMQVHHVMLRALRECDYASIMEKLPGAAPNGADLIAILRSQQMVGRNEMLLLSVWDLLEDAFHLAAITDMDCVAFLLLPWFMTGLISVERGGSSLMKTVQKLSLAFKGISGDAVRRRTLNLLARLPCLHEMRMRIFAGAFELESETILVAIELCPVFLFTLDKTSRHQFLTRHILPLADRPEINKAVVLRAIAGSICAMDPETRLDSNGHLQCSVCHRRGISSNSRTKWIVSMELRGLLAKVFQTDKIDKDVRIGASSVLEALLKHLEPSNDVDREIMERLIKVSFSQVKLADDDFCEEFGWSLSEIVRLPLASSTIEALEVNLAAMSSITSLIVFLEICIMDAIDRSFVLHCFAKTIFLALDRPDIAWDCAVNMLKLEMQRAGVASPSVFFVQNCSQICRWLASGFCQAIVDTPIEARKSLIDGYLINMTKLFGFDATAHDQRKAEMSVIGLLRASVRHLVPELCARGSAEGFWLVDQLQEKLGTTKWTIIGECYPMILVRLTLSDDADRRNEEVFNAFKSYIAPLKMNDLAGENLFQCTVYLLVYLSENESKILHQLKGLNGCERAFNLTTFLKPRYLGILLRFRRMLLMDEFKAERGIILKSLKRITYLLDGDLRDQTAVKMMLVLRAAPTCAEALDAWDTFIRTLSDVVLVSILPQIIVSVLALIECRDSHQLLKLLFTRVLDLQAAESNAVNRILMVLHCHPRIVGAMKNQLVFPGDWEISSIDVMKACVYLLRLEGVEVAEFVLEKLEIVLKSAVIDDQIAAVLVDALFIAIRRFESANVRLLAARCFGNLGAFDPGRIGLSTKTVINNTHYLIFADDQPRFFVDLLEKATQSLSRMLSDDAHECCSCSIQQLLKLVVEKNPNGESVWMALSETTQKEIEPLRSSSYKELQPAKKILHKRPLMTDENCSSLTSWMSAWYSILISEMPSPFLGQVFRSLRGIVDADFLFAQYILSQVVLLIVLEGQENVQTEMFAVLQGGLNGHAGWERSACHVVFAIYDCLEAWRCRPMNRLVAEGKPRRSTVIDEFLTRLGAAKTEGKGGRLLVAAAERCQCEARALRWHEQFVIEKTEKFNHDQFYALQCIYTQLGQTDGVLGAFECIRQQDEIGVDERILAYEAIGDFTQALPLYGQSMKQQIKCLLRLNEPLLAMNNTVAMLGCPLQDPVVEQDLRAYQVEAAWRLGQWEQVDTAVNSGRSLSTIWGATTAAMLCDIQKKDSMAFRCRVDAARERLAHSLAAVTIEASDAYSQTYKHIVHLHVLKEIEDAVTSLRLLEENSAVLPDENEQLMHRWQQRASILQQNAGVLEPVLSVRRELLRFSNVPAREEKITEAFVWSARLARLAGHLQVAWSFLVQAQAMPVLSLDVAVEEANLQFQKSDHWSAINTLTTVVHKHFPDLVVFNPKNAAEKFSKMKPEDAGQFIDTKLRLTEFEQKAGAIEIGKQYETHLAFQYCGVDSERLHYRVATFLDDFIYAKNMDKVRFDNLKRVFSSYARVMRKGCEYLHHVMPRLITLWLDYGERLDEGNEKMTMASVSSTTTLPISSCSPTESETRMAEWNSMMMAAFKMLDKSYFYSVFPQLISRISHPSPAIFETLKQILAELIVAYPDQCLWQSIAVFRSNPSKQRARCERCLTVFTVAVRMDSSLADAIQNYAYVATALIKVAEDTVDPAKYYNLGSKYAFLKNFFDLGEIDATIYKPILLGGKPQQKASMSENSPPRILLPFQSMLGHANSSNSSRESKRSQVPNVTERVYIQTIQNEYVVMSSVQRPKRLTIVGSDGRYYPILCKAKDELRKDERFMQLNLTVNALLRQHAEALRRQLVVRTYSVVPLQMDGGLIEWVPKAVTIRMALNPLFKEFAAPMMTLSECVALYPTRLSTNATVADNRRLIEETLIPRHPLVMGEWLRRTFTDPSAWYKARLAYTHTTAVMCMIGFILGLGDRHGDNILLDQTTGEVFHVDYNLLFGRGEYLKVPETVPFRLTRNVIDGFGATKVEGVFRKSCEATMAVLREHKHMLLNVMQAFVHDPLAEWWSREPEARTQQQRLASAHATTLDPGAAWATDQAQKALKLIDSRLSGNIETAKNHRPTVTQVPMAVVGQVDSLIKIATNMDNLAAMYPGWAAFI